MEKKKFVHIDTIAATFSRLIDDVIRTFVIQRDNLLLMQSDDARNMEVNDIIASVKSGTIENSNRADLFTALGGVPDPVVTLWGTWVNAALWYSKNWNLVKKIIFGFEEEGVLETKAIAAASDPTVPGALTKIERLFAEMPAILLELESQNVSIIQGLDRIKKWQDPKKQTQTFNILILI